MDELLRLLNKAPEEISVVVMPDFFLDRLITLKQTPAEFVAALRKVASRKGGSIDGISQTDIRGGNAINLTSALAALGVRVTPIVCTNKLGFQQLSFHLNPYNVDTSHVKVLERASVTTALEFKSEGGKANVMIRDLGSLADFGPEDVDDADYRLIEGADYVCLFNWAGTRNFGTELAQTVFQRTKAKGKGKTYYDTADPTPNKEKIPEFIEKILKTSGVDILSLNENEAVTYASYFGNKMASGNVKLSLAASAMESARVLATHCSARIDLHTTAFSATVTKKGEVVVPAFKVKPLRATGAGDAWNAGNIIGDASQLPPECRLTLANAVAACYISSLDGSHPSREQVMRFLERQRS
jgi:sugar/nucleoside kinase (ribokinase family)